MTQLNRLAGEVNITKPSDESSDKFIDIKLKTNYAVVHVRYGSNPELETRRLLKHAKKVSVFTISKPPMSHLIVITRLYVFKKSKCWHKNKFFFNE